MQKKVLFILFYLLFNVPLHRKLANVRQKAFICNTHIHRHRDLAQLVAHVVRDDEVAGSSPVIPTIRPIKAKRMNIKDIIYLQRSDRQAFLVILFVMTVSIALVVLIGNSQTETAEQSIDSTQNKLIEEATEQKPLYYHDETQVKEAFPFDPNTASSAQLKRLGLQTWQIRSILRYRAKGGVYRRPSDFARVYGITKRQYEALYPFIRIADEYRPASDFYGNEPYTRHKAGYNHYKTNGTYPNENLSDNKKQDARTDGKVYSYPQKLKAGQHININSADTTALMKIPGIGSHYAKSIIRYRERLGGYAKTEQLLEIEGFPEAALFFITIDKEHIKKLNVNNLSLSQLRKHPYLNYYQAKEICDYRRMRGPLKSLQELRLLKDFPPDEIERLEPYITF